MKMKRTIGMKIGGGYFVAAVVFIIVGVTSYMGLIKLTETAYKVIHTYSVIVALEDLCINMLDAQRGERGFILTGQERYLEPYNAAIKKVNQHLMEVRRLIQERPAQEIIQQKRLDSLESLVAEEFADLKKVIELRRNKGFDAASKVVMSGEIKKVMDEIRKIITEIENEELNILKLRREEAESNTSYTKATIIFGTIFAIVFVSLAGVLITRNISGPLKEVSSAAEKISTGDLSVNLPSSERKDEIGVLTNSFLQMIGYLREMAGVARQIAGNNLTVTIKPVSERDVLGNAFANMVENLRKVTQEIQNSVSILTSSVAEILTSTSQLASITEETATSVNETTTTVEEVKQTAHLSSEKSRKVSESAQNVVSVAEQGKAAVTETLEGINLIKGYTESVAENIIKLSEQSQAIGEIITTVNDLAQQSNLLAVNAAIEAAKAGEQGKGFAVVAQEVKSLADQSKQATIQVREILSDIQKATGTAVMATERVSKAVEDGVTQATESGESIRKLADSIVEAAQAAAQIAVSSQQQLAGMDQIALAMEQIRQAAQQNAAGTRQTEQAAHNLNELGQNLKTVVERFKL